MLRICTKCGQEKELERFVRQRGKYREDPYRKDCKDCKNTKRRKGTLPYRIPKGSIPWNKGLKSTDEHRKNLSDSHKGNIPPNKGKITSTRRFSRLYKVWSAQVKAKDDNKCQICGSTEKLHAHHIKPWKDHQELRLEVDNGKTLCLSCHSKIEGYQQGHKHSESSKEKMRKAKLGYVPWNKGLKK